MMQDDPTAMDAAHWKYLLACLGLLALIGVAVAAILVIRQRLTGVDAVLASSGAARWMEALTLLQRWQATGVVPADGWRQLSAAVHDSHGDCPPELRMVVIQALERLPAISRDPFIAADMRRLRDLLAGQR
jgi:hypothetical protein